MKRYLLDTPVLSAYVLGRAGAQALVTPWVDLDEAATSIVVYAEIIEYFQQFRNFAQRRNELRQLLSHHIPPYRQSYRICEIYADIRRTLRSAAPGSMLPGDSDVVIAATAIRHNLTVVTIDRDFTRISAMYPELKTMVISQATLR